MWKKSFAISGIVVFFCLNSLAVSYDSCKDILRDGIRDTLSTKGKIDRNIALHHQFCSIAKENNLNESNFHNFAKNYAKKVKSTSDSYSGGVGVSVGPFSFNGNYSQTNGSQDLTTSEKENLLQQDAKKIIEYYKSHCGESSYEDSLQAESVVLSKVANRDIVDAWRRCMLGKAGFFADLIGSPRGDDKELEYDIRVRWSSEEGTKITSIVLRYQNDKISGPYPTLREDSGFVKTVNLCDSEKCILVSGSSFPLSLIHKDRSRSANIRIIAMTDTGVAKSHILILPKLIVPEPIKIDPPQNHNPITRTTHGDDEMRTMMNTLNLGKNETTHSDDAMRTMMRNAFNQ
jgi:hypothetical protein